MARIKIEDIALDQKEVHFADHEVYLSFNSDTEALAFRDWLAEGALVMFEAYYERHKGDYA